MLIFVHSGRFPLFSCFLLPPSSGSILLGSGDLDHFLLHITITLAARGTLTVNVILQSMVAPNAHLVATGAGSECNVSIVEWLTAQGAVTIDRYILVVI